MEKNSSTQDLGSTLRSTRVSRVAAWALGGVVVLALAGCGGLLKVGYNNGDTTGLFMMNRYLDLSKEQKEFIKPRLRELLVWHRATQLPDYAALATELQQKAQQTITAGEVAALGEQSRRRAYTTINHAMLDMADITLRLTPANIKTLEDKFSENDEDFRKENLKVSVEKQQKARYDKTLDRVEEFYGSFNREQRAAIRRLSDARPLDNEVLFAERQRREQEIVALLVKVERDKPSRENVVAMLKAYADRFERSPDPERRAFMDRLHQATDEMNAQIHNLATPQQRAKAAAKLQKLIDDFRSLSAEAS